MTKTTFLARIFSFFILPVLLGTCSAASLTLVDDGQPRAEIIISETPKNTVRLAAQELQDYIKKISGAELPIVTAPNGNIIKIYVGQSSYTDELGISANDLKDGAYRIKTGKDWLVLIGEDIDFTPPGPWAQSTREIPQLLSEWREKTNSVWLLPGLPRYQMHRDILELPGDTGEPTDSTNKKDKKLTIWKYDERGSFNAVCNFLKKLGVRWYMPGDLGEVVPEQKTISVSAIDETIHPDFPIRHLALTFSRGYDAAMWWMRLGLRWPYGYEIAHGLNHLSQSPDIFAAHPEWYAVRDGKPYYDPDSGKNQLNLANEDLIKETVRYVRAVFDTYHFDAVSIMPPDGFGVISQDKESLSQETPERGRQGTLSDYVWNFVNRVAKEVKKTHPNKIVTNCAYTLYALPPEKIEKLESNVQVVIVGGRAPYKDEAEERKLLYKAWQEKTDNPIMIWENYPLTGRGYYLPAFAPHAIANSINETKGTSMGDNVWITTRVPFTDTTEDMGFDHFQAYFTASMYWGGTNADVDKILGEYCRLFYGSAAEEMRTFLSYCEENWRDMDKDKVKADQALALFDVAKAKADATSVYGKRMTLIDDYLGGLRKRSHVLGKGRGPVPTIRLIHKSSDARDIVIDGKLDDAGWQEFNPSSTGILRELQTGRIPTYGTTFKVAMSKSRKDIYFAIRCEEPDNKLKDITKRNDDLAMWVGDAIEIELGTQEHSYYQIAVSPSGYVTDIDRMGGKVNFDWNSQAEVATHIGDGYWTVEIRIPVTTDENDPLQQVIGQNPSKTLPWYFNINRQRIRDDGEEFSAFSPTGKKGYHFEEKFARLYAGTSHKFESEPTEDYLNDLTNGHYIEAASREGITDEQKSYALAQAAADGIKNKDWEAVDDIIGQIPIESIQKTVMMQKLRGERKFEELFSTFGNEEIDSWPFWQRSEGFFVRGEALYQKSLTDSTLIQKATVDLENALKYTNKSYENRTVDRHRKNIEDMIAKLRTLL